METPAVVSFRLFKILSATLGFVSVQTRADSIFGMLTRRRELLHNTGQSSHKKIHHTFSRLTWQDKIAVGCRSCQATYWLQHLLSVNFLFVSIQRRITKGRSPPFKKKKSLFNSCRFFSWSYIFSRVMFTKLIAPGCSTYRQWHAQFKFSTGPCPRAAVSRKRDFTLEWL